MLKRAQGHPRRLVEGAPKRGFFHSAAGFARVEVTEAAPEPMEKEGGFAVLI